MEQPIKMTLEMAKRRASSNVFCRDHEWHGDDCPWCEIRSDRSKWLSRFILVCGVAFITWFIIEYSEELSEWWKLWDVRLLVVIAIVITVMFLAVRFLMFAEKRGKDADDISRAHFGSHDDNLI